MYSSMAYQICNTIIILLTMEVIGRVAIVIQSLRWVGAPLHGASVITRLQCAPYMTTWRRTD